MKKLIVFDLDGTLAPSKSPVDDEMADLLGKLVAVVKTAIISGGDWPQFQKQVVARMAPGANLANLVILPTSGTKYYEFDDGNWTQRYAENLSDVQKKTIEDALEAAVAQSGLQPAQTWGERIEDRGTQITYSALGQQAPLDAKEKWDPDFSKRQTIKSVLDKTLPGYSVRLGGTTSIDVTLPGIDKAYGIHKLRDILSIPIEAMLYVGDAIFPGGNDYAAKEAGVDCIPVRDPDETKRVIEAIVACS